MHNNLRMKGFVLGVILVFVGTSVTQSITGDIGTSYDTSSYKENNKKPMPKLMSSNNPPVEEWNRTYGGTDYDGGFSGQQTIDSGYIIVGFTDSFGKGDTNIWLIKTDTAGHEEWNRTFGGVYANVGISVLQTTDEGYIITGFYGAHFENSTLYGDVWLIKTNGDGIEQWNKTYGGAGWDCGKTVQQTKDGGYIIVGETYSYSAGNNGSDDIWLIKTDVNGNVQWNKTFGGEQDDRGRSVQQTTDDGYILIGSTESYGDGSSDFWLVKTDVNGNEQWNSTFGGDKQDDGSSVQQTKDGGYILTGTHDIYVINYTLYQGAWLIKTNANGKEQWNKTFAGKNAVSGFSALQTTDGGYIIGGNSNSLPSNHVWLIKTDASGNVLWNKTFGVNNSQGLALQRTKDDGFIIIGYIDSNHGDTWLLKLKNECPASKKAFIFGRYAYLEEQDGYITIDALNLRLIQFKPFHFNHYVAWEKITFLNDTMKGLIFPQYIIGIIDMVT